MPASQEAINGAFGLLAIKEGDVVWDLGCGDARVLIDFWRKQPRASYIGMEIKPFPYLLAIFNVWRSGARKAIKIRRGDFFKEDFASANAIYMYLFPKLMDQLLPKLERELPQGAVLVSPTFRFSQKKEGEIMQLKPQRGNIIKTLNLYRF